MNKLYYDQLDDYHLGKLPAAEVAAFEAALENDPALAIALREHRLEWEARELLAEQQLRAQIRRAFAEQTTIPPRSGAKTVWKWAALGLLLLLLGAGMYFLRKTRAASSPAPINVPRQTPPPVPELEKESAPPPPIANTPATPSSRQLALAAYHVPEGLSQTRGAQTTDTLGLAQAAFARKKYDQVIRLLAVLPEDDTQEALSLRAHAKFAAGQFAAAQRDFKALETCGIYRREAQWFGLLAEMATTGTDPSAWESRLQTIRKDPKHPFQQAAEKLWKEVEKR